MSHWTIANLAESTTALKVWHRVCRLHSCTIWDFQTTFWFGQCIQRPWIWAQKWRWDRKMADQRPAVQKWFEKLWFFEHVANTCDCRHLFSPDCQWMELTCSIGWKFVYWQRSYWTTWAPSSWVSQRNSPFVTPWRHLHVREFHRNQTLLLLEFWVWEFCFERWKSWLLDRVLSKKWRKIYLETFFGLLKSCSESRENLLANGISVVLAAAFLGSFFSEWTCGLLSSMQFFTSTGDTCMQSVIANSIHLSAALIFLGLFVFIDFFLLYTHTHEETRC